jgi:hypothetical protein
VVAGPTALFITLRGLECVRENRRQNESRRGRLNISLVQVTVSIGSCGRRPLKTTLPSKPTGISPAGTAESFPGRKSWVPTTQLKAHSELKDQLDSDPDQIGSMQLAKYLRAKLGYPLPYPPLCTLQYQRRGSHRSRGAKIRPNR